MADPHVIVRSILRFDPPIDKAADTSRVSGNLTVHFDDEQIAHLDPLDPNFALRHEVLTGLYSVHLPVYAEVDPESRIITNLLLPTEGKVKFLARDSSGGVILHLDNSARPFALPASHPKYREFLHTLREAQLDDVPVLVTETGRDSAIEDIRRSPNPPAPALHDVLAGPAALLPAITRAVSPDRAMEMFRLVAARSCDPAAPDSSCIPFLYPDNGCHARAHEMCRLITNAGVHPAKVWNYSRTPRHPLTVETHNAPKCEVKWVFHVAVALEVKTPGQEEPHTVVIDPSLFPHGPVPVATWQSVQGDPNSCLEYTTPVPFLPPAPASVTADPNDSKTNQELIKYRLALRARAGKIPFNCPGKQ